MSDAVRPLTRRAASAAVEAAGWRLVFTGFAASVPAASLAQAAEIARLAVDAAGGDADEHLIVDLRADRVELVVQSRPMNAVTAHDADIAHAITDRLRRSGLEPAAPVGPGRPVQLLEIAIDALDIAAIRPFWKVVLDYVDAPGAGPEGPLLDPAGQLPSLWFQQMDVPRRERNRIHFDLDVAHDEAGRRLAAALDAGGVLVNADNARAWWVLADREGNEICICTWQDRD
jgi:4a-hydroxytetrahydrobiopterin dehydratase